MQKVILGSKSLIRRTLQITEQNSFFIRPLSINSFRWQSTTSNGASSSADGTDSSSKVEQNTSSGNLSAEAIKIKEFQTELDVTKKKVKELLNDRMY
jgi:hypothetical protein